MDNSSDVFIDEIKVHFLTCFLCSCEYKRPKSLTCMHTFCQACLEKHYDKDQNTNLYRYLNYTKAITCPVCESKTALPTGGIERLQNNFFLDNLNKVLEKKNHINNYLTKTNICEICTRKNENATGSRAVSRCLDCFRMLCKTCKSLHEATNVTRLHTVIDISDVEEIQCKEHSTEIAKLYCQSCEQCICIMCTFGGHKEHDIITLDEALVMNTLDLEEMLGMCTAKLNTFTDILAYINRCQDEMRSFEELVREESMLMVTAVRTGERRLISEMHRCVNEKSKNLLINKDTIETKLQKLDASRKITSVLLAKKDYELLKAKSDLKEQLSSVLAAEDFENYFILDKYTFSNKKSYVDELINFIYNNEYLIDKFKNLSESDSYKASPETDSSSSSSSDEATIQYNLIEKDDDDDDDDAALNLCTIVNNGTEVGALKITKEIQTKIRTTAHAQTMTDQPNCSDQSAGTEGGDVLDKATSTIDLITNDVYNKFGNLFDPDPASNGRTNKDVAAAAAQFLEHNGGEDMQANINMRTTPFIKNGGVRSEVKITPSKIEFVKPQEIVIRTAKILVVS